MTPSGGGSSDGLDRAAFLDRFQRLPLADRRAFVADLWARTGWRTDVDGSVITATRESPTAETNRILVTARATDADSIDADVDAVVATAGSGAAAAPDVSVITPEDLYRRARYGLDPGTADRLFEEHFGRPLDDGGPVESDGPPAVSEASPAPSSVPSEPSAGAGHGRGALLAAGGTGAAVALLLVAAVAWAGGVPLGTAIPASTSTSTPETTTPTGVPETTPPATSGAASEDVDTVTIADRYADLRPTCDRPPGVVIAIQLGALRTNDPSNNRGIMTVYRFASRANRQATGPFSNFVDIVTSERYAPLLTFERVLLGPIEERRRGEEGRRTRISRTVVVFGPSGNASAYEFTLTRDGGGTYGECWKTDSVVTVPLNDTAAEDVRR